jgi:hypothetical protein
MLASGERSKILGSTWSMSQEKFRQKNMATAAESPESTIRSMPIIPMALRSINNSSANQSFKIPTLKQNGAISAIQLGQEKPLRPQSTTQKKYKKSRKPSAEFKNLKSIS